MKHTEYIIPIGEDAKDYDEMFIGVIRRQPELVRCKECKHRPHTNEWGHIEPPQVLSDDQWDGWADDEKMYEDDMTCPYVCGDSYYNRIPEDNQYCDRAERKEE